MQNLGFLVCCVDFINFFFNDVIFHDVNVCVVHLVKLDLPLMLPLKI